jgi:uncharacterized membrane protein
MDKKRTSPYDYLIVRMSSIREHHMDLRRGSLALAVLATGLSAGFFVTYAISVSRGLARVDDETYVLTMQSINDTVRTGWFAAFFFGSLPLLVVAAVLAAGATMRLVLAGAAAVYTAGVLGVTFLANVPMNDDLADQTGRSAAVLAAARSDFEDPWNGWNLVRTIAALIVFAATTGLAAFDRRRDDRAGTAEP